MIAHLPTPEQRQWAAQQVQDFASGQISCEAMMRRVGGLLRTYRLKRLRLGRYQAVIVGNYQGMPIVHIIPMPSRQVETHKMDQGRDAKWRYRF